jgi:hypothetical protein
MTQTQESVNIMATMKYGTYYYATPKYLEAREAHFKYYGHNPDNVAPIECALMTIQYNERGRCWSTHGGRSSGNHNTYAAAEKQVMENFPRSFCFANDDRSCGRVS